MPNARSSPGAPDVWSWTCCATSGPLPRDIVTRKSLENGAAIVAATGGSTNAALHLPAIANEAGIKFTIDDVGEVFARTPLIGNLGPGGKYVAKDVYDIGGTAVVDSCTGRERPYRRLLHHHHRPDHCGGIRQRQQGRWRDHLQLSKADHARWRRRGAEGQPVPRWRGDQGRRPEEDGVRGHGARVRGRRKLRRRGEGPAATRKATC